MLVFVRLETGAQGVRIRLDNAWGNGKEGSMAGGMEAYCVKCKAKKEMKDGQKVKMKNGRPAMKGRCPDCGTGAYRILKP